VDPTERANREAELAHELELLKRKEREHLDAVHLLRNRMQVVSLRLQTIRRGHGDPGEH
jgi:hypothetical protein